MSNLNFITILFIGFIDYLGIALVYPIFAAMLFDTQYPLVPPDASLAFRGSLLGVLIGLTPLTQFFAAPLLGSLSDCKGRKSTLQFGILAGFIGNGLAILGVLFHSLTLLFFYRFLVGIASGTVPVAQALIADMSTEENKGRRFSLFSASLGAGFTVGPFLGGKLASMDVNYSYALPFLAAGLMCLVSLAVVIPFPEIKIINLTCDHLHL
ncbi:MAG: MFS transporter [Parachlamydia sp.]|nr:MFS transporter [Parachlamydia sp.]